MVAVFVFTFEAMHHKKCSILLCLHVHAFLLCLEMHVTFPHAQRYSC